jgi:hypothetical protein
MASLAHYTNLAGFHGILESGQLWASNVAFLNDREELLHGVKCARGALSKIVSDRKLRDWSDAIRQVVKQIEEGRLPNTYAACFCEKSDLLSQWRGYGGNEQGIGLVFDSVGIESLKTGKRSFLAPVQYGIVNGKTTLHQSLRERLVVIGQDDLSLMVDNEKQETVYNVLSELIPRFKHKGFEDELEWRLVVQHATLRSSVSFRPNKNVLIPYIRLGGGILPLKYVRIGPGPDQALTRRSVAQYLEAKGYEIDVKTSNVPFRH